MERQEYFEEYRINENILLETEIERKNFTRAAHLAASLDLADKELKHIQHQALWQMAATYRNSHGTKALAQQNGYTNQEAGGSSRKMAACFCICSEMIGIISGLCTESPKVTCCIIFNQPHFPVLSNKKHLYRCQNCIRICQVNGYVKQFCN